MKKSILSLLIGCSLAFAGCSLEGEDTQESQEAQASHAILSDPAEAEAFSEASEIGTEACQGSYDADVAAVRTFIHDTCGGITGCGSIDSFNHADVFIGGNYCDCYNALFANRASGAFSRVQIIYHEPGGCTSKHIHVEKKSLCGRIHYDLDEGGGQNCFDDEPSSKWDRWFGGGNCTTPQHNSRIGTCNS
jgi:hypothetical protein